MDDKYYEKDGMKYARVTAILNMVRNPELEDWQMYVGKREANRIRKEALKVGTALHEYVQAFYEQRKLPEVKGESLSNVVKAFVKWDGMNKPKIETLEKTVYDEELRVAGTPDLVTESFFGEVIDWKTGKSVGWRDRMQVNTYLHMTDIRRGRIVRLDKAIGEFEEFKVEYDYEMWQAFKKLAEFYYWKESQNGGLFAEGEVRTEQEVG